MPGRQVIVYDKRAEVLTKHKPGWWEIWDEARSSAGKSALERSDAAKSRVWRVELRAGKHHLKDSWAIRRWGDLDRRFGDMITAMLHAVRHAVPSGDSNRSRWRNSELWALTRQAIVNDLSELTTGVAPDLVKRVQREEHDRLLERQMAGLLTTRAAIRGLSASDLPEFAITAGQAIAAEARQHPRMIEQNLARAKKRYIIDGEDQASSA